MIENADVGVFSRRLVEGARSLYADLTEQLRKALEQLKQDNLIEEAKSLSETIRAHRKALQVLLDIEIGFSKTAEGTTTSNDLDLEAAKTEVLGRLDRLAAARRHRGFD